ncbi:hypothetical protein PC116_g19971 [Phytophthora cactorum]|nr:hypothetical protein PC116_g19971 [Phytophthora cactorum]
MVRSGSSFHDISHDEAFCFSHHVLVVHAGDRRDPALSFGDERSRGDDRRRPSGTFTRR